MPSIFHDHRSLERPYHVQVSSDQRTLRFSLAVVKVVSRCNLNCSYCYMYNKGDNTYLDQPAVMSRDTVEALVSRVAEHCTKHGLSAFKFVFHGGEPLMAHQSFYRFFVERARLALLPQTKPLFSMQTNGTLLTREWCDFLRESKINIGISLDGPQSINDLYRIDHSGKGSYRKVRRGWDIAVEAGLSPGILTVIDPDTDPLQIYEHIKELNPQKVDFLFPEATHDDPPPNYSITDDLTPFADWLFRIFEIWVNEDTSQLRIRLFEQIIGSVLGLSGNFDALGTGPNEVVVIETNGSIEPVDVLRACRNGITRTPLNVSSNALDEAATQQIIELYYFSNDRLCAICDKCMVKNICAGGYLSHRYRRSNAFDNPSVYCRDLLKLITKIQNWVVNGLPEDILAKTRCTALNYAEAKARIS